MIMLSKFYCFIIFLCIFTCRTFANSDLATTDNTQSSDMPASVVLLLLIMFIALAFIGIRHIKREYIQQQSYLFRKQAGSLFNTHITNKSYGSTFSPELNSDNIDTYISDQLYGNNIIFDRINYYTQLLQQRFINYMESTPEPVLYEVITDKNKGVEAYNKNPEIPSNPNYQNKPLEHSSNYDSQIQSHALQKLFQTSYQKNQQRKLIGNDRECKEKFMNNLHRECNDDNEDNDGYDEIPENNTYSDSDKEISDSDNGNGDCNKTSNDKPVLTKKVVVLDLD
eukprot:556371_1